MTRTTDEILKDAGGYEAIVKDMDEDLHRTTRKRDVEACFAGNIEHILQSLHAETDSKAAMLRRINDSLESNGKGGSLSRPTLYRWLEEHVDES